MSNAGKTNLRQIEEEGSTTEIPMTTLHVDTLDTKEELKRELTFYELWGKHYWRQFTSITPGELFWFFK